MIYSHRSLLWVGVVMVATGWMGQAGVTINAASAELTDINAAVSTAGTGDQVIVPAGSATWSGPLVITKCITLKGSGIGATIIEGNITDPYNGMISIKPSATAMSANQLIRVTGFTLNANRKSNGIYVYNDTATPVTKVRVDHNRILNAGGVSAGRGVYIRGTVYGVADHNVLENYTHGMDGEGNNSLQWETLTQQIGTGLNFYFEDNELSSTNANVFHAGGQGGRYVARYNNYKNLSTGNIFPVFDMHGNQPSDLCGTMVVESYGNNVDLGTKGGRIFDQRGGILMAFNNKITWGSDGANSQIREEYLDSRYPAGNTYPMHVRESYYWNNRANGILMPAPTVTNNQYEDTYDIVQNVDFWVQNNNYNGVTETGVFCGSSLPLKGSVGDGAWITSQSLTNLAGMVGKNPSTPIVGKFYRCTAPDVWTPVYQPYIYPHPLANEPRPPSNLVVR